MTRLLVLLTLGVSVLLVACGGGGDKEPVGSATPSPTSRQIPLSSPVTTAGIASPGATDVAVATEQSEVAASSPTATQVWNYCNTDVPEAAATPTDVQTLPVGHACIADAGDDLKSEAGDPAVAPLPGADIAAIRIDSNGSVLLVTFYGNQPIPTRVEDGTSISWNVDLLQENVVIYNLSIRLTPGDWDIIITDAAGSTQKLRLTSLYGKRLETPFQAEVLPKLTGPFTFRAWTESVGADGVTVFDWAPDAAGVDRNDPDAAVPFPE